MAAPDQPITASSTSRARARRARQASGGLAILAGLTTTVYAIVGYQAATNKPEPPLVAEVRAYEAAIKHINRHSQRLANGELDQSRETLAQMLTKLKAQQGYEAKANNYDRAQQHRQNLNHDIWFGVASTGAAAVIAGLAAIKDNEQRQ